MNDRPGIYRVVNGFSKTPDEDGEQHLEVMYKLKPLDMSFLQKLFKINPQDEDPVERDVCYCYDIDEHQAKALQPYVIDGVIDLEKYDFVLHAYSKLMEDT